MKRSVIEKEGEIKQKSKSQFLDRRVPDVHNLIWNERNQSGV